MVDSIVRTLADLFKVDTARIGRPQEDMPCYTVNLPVDISVEALTQSLMAVNMVGRMMGIHNAIATDVSIEGNSAIQFQASIFDDYTKILDDLIDHKDFISNPTSVSENGLFTKAHMKRLLEFGEQYQDDVINTKLQQIFRANEVTSRPTENGLYHVITLGSAQEAHRAAHIVNLLAGRERIHNAAQVSDGNVEIGARALKFTQLGKILNDHKELLVKSRFYDVETLSELMEILKEEAKSCTPIDRVATEIASKEMLAQLFSVAAHSILTPQPLNQFPYYVVGVEDKERAHMLAGTVNRRARSLGLRECAFVDAREGNLLLQMDMVDGSKDLWSALLSQRAVLSALPTEYKYREDDHFRSYQTRHFYNLKSGGFDR